MRLWSLDELNEWIQWPWHDAHHIEQSKPSYARVSYERSIDKPEPTSFRHTWSGFQSQTKIKLQIRKIKITNQANMSHQLGFYALVQE